MHIETKTDDNQLNSHLEHVLVAKGDSNSVIPEALSTKFHDRSFVEQGVMKVDGLR